MLKKVFSGLLMGIVSFSQPAISQQLAPGDGIRLTVYNISDAVSGDYFIQNDGTIQLPYIGSLNVRDQYLETLRAEIDQRYRMIYREPEMIIQPIYKIKVLGEVTAPGVYYITGVEKLSDLLALAGGETQDANLNKIYLLRDGRKIDIDAGEILQKGRKLNDFGLRSGDHVYVSRKKVLGLNNASVIISAAALIITTVALVSSR